MDPCICRAESLRCSPETIRTLLTGYSTVSLSVESVQPRGLQPTRLLCPWYSPGKNTEWVVIPFSRGSSCPRDQTRVSCNASRFFTTWATRDASYKIKVFFLKKKKKRSAAKTIKSSKTKEREGGWGRAQDMAPARLCCGFHSINLRKQFYTFILGRD